MSATVTMTTASAATSAASPAPTMSLMTEPPPPPPPSDPAPPHSCPSCGFGIGSPPTVAPLVTTSPRSPNAGKVESEDASRALLEAQARIADLEAQVRMLNQRASAAVDRWADYEDELAKLHKQLEAQSGQPRQSQEAPSPAAAPTPSLSPTRSSFLLSSGGGVANRISALLSPRKSQPNLCPPPLSPAPSDGNLAPALYPGPTTAAAASSSEPALASTSASPAPGDVSSHPLNAHSELLSALHHEQSLRKAAETRLSSTSKEVEELSVSLFEQANEMVATERRARAKLEERVDVLEKRDVEKKHRLERLEGAMGRIERVRAIIGEERVRKMRDEVRAEREAKEAARKG